jgi:fructokinase
MLNSASAMTPFMPTATQPRALFVLGEALMDCVAQANGQLLPLAGGSPYNLARAAALQGVSVHYLNPFSSDRFGQILCKQLLADGAHSASPVSPKPTSLAIVQTQNGQPSYGFYREGVADRDYQVADILNILRQHKPGVLHTGSLALMPPESEKVLTIIKAAKAQGWTISLDVNLRPLLARDLKAYQHAVLEAMACADWLKASDEDLEILGLDAQFAAQCQAGQLPQIAASLKNTTVQRVALTAGSEGAALWLADAQANPSCAWQSAYQVAVLDTVGAGDTFWASCLADWMEHPEAAPQGLNNTLQRAMAAAAINCSRHGCQPPNGAEVSAFLRAQPKPLDHKASN